MSSEDLGIADFAQAIGLYRVDLARQNIRYLACIWRFPGDDLRRRRVEHAT